MKWLANLELWSKTKKTGRCPYCNSVNTDYALQEVDKTNRFGYGVIWCNDCKKAYHISRIKITDKNDIKPIPDDLEY